MSEPADRDRSFGFGSCSTCNVGFISTVVLPTSFSFVEKTSDSVYLRDFFAYLKSKKAKNKSEKKEH